MVEPLSDYLLNCSLKVLLATSSACDIPNKDKRRWKIVQKKSSKSTPSVIKSSDQSRGHLVNKEKHPGQRRQVHFSSFISMRDSTWTESPSCISQNNVLYSIILIILTCITGAPRCLFCPQSGPQTSTLGYASWDHQGLLSLCMCNLEMERNSKQ